jgi:hypothetical protein
VVPTLALVRIDSPHFRCPTIPVPLFLLWILAVVLSPLLLVLAIVGWAVCAANGFPFWRGMVMFWTLLCALPGTDVRVATEGNHVTVRIL